VGPRPGAVGNIVLMAAVARRPRRSSVEVQKVILAAAEDLFGITGFAGTTTRAVAKQAGVAEALVYTNFASKTRLFEAAVVDRYESFLAEHVARWSQGITTPPTCHASTSSTGSGFVHDILRRQPQSVSHLSGVSPARQPTIRPAKSRLRAPVADFGRGLGRARTSVRNSRARRAGHRTCVISMVLRLVLHDHVLFTGIPQPGREHLVREVTALILSGIEAPEHSRPIRETNNAGAVAYLTD
jgi:AcrR family transcriptional regulator